MAEPILLLAHEDRERLLAADVEIEYEHGVPLLDPEQSDVVFKRIDIEKGDVDAGLARADLSDRGHLPDGRAGARLHRAERCDCRSGGGRRRRVRLDPVSVLRAQGARHVCWATPSITCASCRPRRAAGSAARRSIRR